MPSDRFDVLFFGAVDWSHTWQRPQQLASRLAAQGRVVYVDPIGLRGVRLSDAPRLVRRLRAADAAAAVRPPGLSVISGHAATMAAGLRAPREWTARLVLSAVRPALRAAGIEHPVILAGAPSPALVAALDGLPSRLLVYDCLDAVTAFRAGPPEVEAAEAALARRADLVLATSRELETRMRRHNPRTVLVPNAADYDHFARAIARRTRSRPSCAHCRVRSWATSARWRPGSTPASYAAWPSATPTGRSSSWDRRRPKPARP